MSQDLKSQLSALMDNELEKDASRFLLKRVEGDAELAASWSRWHLARDCLSGHLQAPARADLADRVAAALADERAPRQSGLQPILRWAAGAAIAASVAVAALLVVPGNAPTGADSGPAVGAIATAPAEVVPSGLSERDLRPSLAPVAQSVSRSQAMSLPPAVQVDPRVDAWLIRHSAATPGAQGGHFVSYIPVVSPHRAAAQRVVVDAAPPRR